MEEFHNDHQIRYRLAAKTEGNFDWLFVPGGPGADSTYFNNLLAHLELPGRTWLIDLPGNGTNPAPNGYDYDQWLEIFPRLFDRFDHPVLIGHSAGGHLALLGPELEERLAGLVILNNPSSGLGSNSGYYFAPKHLAARRNALLRVPFPFKPAAWWQRKAVQIDYSAKWAPQELPTLIMGGRYDCVCPFTLFQQDERFYKKIELAYIEDAGFVLGGEPPCYGPDI
jgi:pimeloyl-ACP methyl ester carboxylesterase